MNATITPIDDVGQRRELRQQALCDAHAPYRSPSRPQRRHHQPHFGQARPVQPEGVGCQPGQRHAS